MTAFEKTKYAVQSMLRLGNFRERGTVLEEFFRELLIELRANNVILQRRGIQYGRDFSFVRRDQLHYAECKNLATDVTVDHLTNKVIWLPLIKPADYYVLVSPTPIDNTLRQYLLSNHLATTFLDWTGENFFLVCSQAPITVGKYCRVDIGPVDEEIARRAVNLLEYRDGVYPPNAPLRIQVHHTLMTPFMEVYYESEDGVERTFPLGDTTYRIRMFNPNSESVSIDNLECQVIRCGDLPNRIVGWAKFKGVIKPPVLRVDVSHGVREFKDLLQGKEIHIDGKSHETVDLHIVGQALGGLFRAQFTGQCVTRHGANRLMFESLPFISITDDIPSEQFLGFFGSDRNEMTARQVLSLVDNQWNQLAASGTRSPESRYLGVLSDSDPEDWIAKTGEITIRLSRTDAR